MNLGWVKLHRKLSDNKLWTSEPFTRGQAWVDMLMLANHKEDFFYVRGNRVTVQRGQLGWSQLGLSKRWQWSRGKVKRFLNELETDQQIVQQNNFISSLIIIVNYEEYQGDGQQIVQQTDSEQTADGQQTDTNKNDKKEKNVKNVKKKHKYGELNHVLLTDEEYRKLVEKFGADGTAHWIKTLDEGLDLKDYKYKSHYRAILKWSKNPMNNPSDPDAKTRERARIIKEATDEHEGI